MISYDQEIWSQSFPETGCLNWLLIFFSSTQPSVYYGLSHFLQNWIFRRCARQISKSWELVYFFGRVTIQQQREYNSNKAQWVCTHTPIPWLQPGRAKYPILFHSSTWSSTLLNMLVMGILLFQQAFGTLLIWTGFLFWKLGRYFCSVYMQWAIEHIILFTIALWYVMAHWPISFRCACITRTNLTRYHIFCNMGQELMCPFWKV